MNRMMIGVCTVAVLLGVTLSGAVAHEVAMAPTNESAARAAASEDSPELAAFRKAIRAKYDLTERSFALHDAETIVSKFYSADAITVGEGDGIYIGRDQIRPLYQEVVQGYTLKIDSVYTFVKGDAGWDWADFNVTPLDKRYKPFTFAILFLWNKVQGDWICKGDFFVNGSFRTGKLTAPPEMPPVTAPRTRSQ